MAISLIRDINGKGVIRVDTGSEAPSPPTPAAPSPNLPDGWPQIVIDNGEGAQALILKFATEIKPAVSFAHLALKPAIRVDAAKATNAKTNLVSVIALSLRSGGSGAQPIELEWEFKDELSLNDFANALSTELQLPTTIEIPGVVTVSGRL